MPNTNCLEDMECPCCKSEGPYKIAVETIAEVHDSGIEDSGDNHWDGDSYCECMECLFHGTAKDFYIKVYDNEKDESKRKARIAERVITFKELLAKQEADAKAFEDDNLR
jgi:hypothetical protein